MDEPILTREDKSYKEAKRILNELVKYSNCHHRSVVKNCILMCVILTSLLVQAMLKPLVHPLMFEPNTMPLETVFGLSTEIPIVVCLVALISATTCFDVPCCWKFGFKNAKFSMFGNLHIFRLVLLLLYLIIMTAYTVFTIYCLYQAETGLCAQYPLFNYIKSMVIFVIVLFVLLYVLIMLVIINIKCCYYKNRFRPVLSCRNLAHEIIMIDICDDSNKIYQHRLIENVIEII